MSGRILFFGKLRDAAGTGEMALPEDAYGLPVSRLPELIAKGDHALLEALCQGSVRVAVNFEILGLGSDVEVQAGSEIAYLPPMSGG